MSANPVLVTGPQGVFPAPFPGEVFVLRRPGVSLELDGVRTASHKWNARGTAHISNVRMVFVADLPDASGLASFDIPLVYTRNDKLNQPIFGCNNISGQVWPAVQGGGPRGSLPPHNWTLYFKEGGMGTFYPMYYTLAQRARRAFEVELQRQQYQRSVMQNQDAHHYQQLQQQQQQAQSPQSPTQQQQQLPFPQQPFMHPPSEGQPQEWAGSYPSTPRGSVVSADDQAGASAPDVPAAYAQQLAAKAFVDPADPSIIYLSSPTTEEQRLPEAPRYAANYGQDEKYIPL